MVIAGCDGMVIHLQIYYLPAEIQNRDNRGGVPGYPDLLGSGGTVSTVGADGGSCYVAREIV